jgi:hypothetical protein
MEMRAILDQLVQRGEFVAMFNNPLAQFGPPTRQYIGATLLPEVTKPVNTFTESYIQYRSIVANAGTRYSQPQPKGNALLGKMLVELAESDTASEFDSQTYDALIDLISILPNNTTLSAVPPTVLASILGWVDMTLLRPLLEFNEMVRWQAIVDANVVLQGANNFTENVAYSNPAGHRFAATGVWGDDTFDPLTDVETAIQLLDSKGYKVSRIITSRNVRNILRKNLKIKQRLGLISLSDGIISGLPVNVTNENLNSFFESESLPAIELYDLQYRTSTTTQYFLKRDVMVICATTGRDVNLDLGDTAPFALPNTLGYTAIGRPANRPGSGRASKVEYNDGKGAPVMGQSWQTSLPVISNPEAIVVISDIEATED